MVLIAKLFCFATLGSAVALNTRQQDDDDPPPTADASEVEYYLRVANNSTKQWTSDIKPFRGNSTNLDNDYSDAYWNVYLIGDAANYRHLEGVLSKSDAQKICKYFNTTLVATTKKFLSTVVANKKKFARYNYTSSIIDNLNNMPYQYDSTAENIDSVSYYGGNQACDDASNVYSNLYASAVSALSN